MRKDTDSNDLELDEPLYDEKIIDKILEEGKLELPGIICTNEEFKTASNKEGMMREKYKTLEELWDFLEKNEFRGDAIARLAYRYSYEDEYTVSNELLICNPDGSYSWENDWDEGQTNVKVLGLIFIDDVEVPGF